MRYKMRDQVKTKVQFINELYRCFTGHLNGKHQTPIVIWQVRQLRIVINKKQREKEETLPLK